jgi:hypothetical protein
MTYHLAQVNIVLPKQPLNSGTRSGIGLISDVWALGRFAPLRRVGSEAAVPPEAKYGSSSELSLPTTEPSPL